MSSNIPRLFTHKGVTHTVPEWAVLMGVPSKFFYYRLNERHLSFEEVLQEVAYWKAGQTCCKKHSLSDTEEYQVWGSIKQKCYNTHNHAYPYVGARGIKVCDRWLTNFEQFYEDVKPYPPDHRFVLINPMKDYSPENCRWEERLQWRTLTTWSTFDGNPLTFSEWSEIIGISPADFRTLIRLCSVKNKSYKGVFIKSNSESGEDFKTKIVHLSKKSRLLTLAGRTQTITEWARRLGFRDASSLNYRLKTKRFEDIVREVCLVNGRSLLSIFKGL